MTLHCIRSVSLAVAFLTMPAFVRFAEQATSAAVLPPQKVGVSPENEAEVIRLPDGSLQVFSANMEHQRIESIHSTDGGRTWSEPKVEFPTEGDTHFAARPLVDNKGELHLFFLRKRGNREAGPIGKDCFIDVYHRRTTNGRSEWLEADPVFVSGYTGSIRGAAQLASGRLAVAFSPFRMPGETYDKGFGRTYCTVSYSDNNGRTWKLSSSQLISPIRETYNGINYGAVEPTIIELADKSLYMLMRTQTGYQYESRSTDAGETWSPAAASPFKSSNSPADFLRLRDGRIVLLWNNCEVPLVKSDAGRDVVHAAISLDEGKTWRGFREIYRDPTRDLPPPKKGDRGAAYPRGAELNDGKIFVVTGQGAHARAMLIVDPAWLMQTTHADDFENGLEGWIAFKEFGPAEGWWRNRTEGARLIADPDKPSEHVLHLRRPDDKYGDGATWNFPMGRKGRLSLRARAQNGFAGGAIALTECFYNPSDDNGESAAMFSLPVRSPSAPSSPEGLALETGKWRSVELNWDLDAQRCNVKLDGKPGISLRLANQTRTGISYLRLRSTALSVDEAGWLADSVQVVVEPLAAAAASTRSTSENGR